MDNTPAPECNTPVVDARGWQTLCSRPAGHPGPCSPLRQPED